MRDPANTKLAKGALRDACPICAAPRRTEYAPFCSKRCADIDLHRWLSGTYAVPGHPAADEGDGKPGALPHDEED